MRRQRVLGFLLVASCVHSMSVMHANLGDMLQWWEQKKAKGTARFQRVRKRVQESYEADLKPAVDKIAQRVFSTESDEETQEAVNFGVTRGLSEECVMGEHERIPVQKRMTLAQLKASAYCPASNFCDVKILTLVVEGRDTLAGVFAGGDWKNLTMLTIIGSKPEFDKSGKLLSYASLTDLHEHDFSGLKNLQKLELVNHPDLYRMPRWIFSKQYVPNLRSISLEGCAFCYGGSLDAREMEFRSECLTGRDDVQVQYGIQIGRDCTWSEWVFSWFDWSYRTSGLRYVKRHAFETEPTARKGH